jgi:hypothetical protein
MDNDGSQSAEANVNQLPVSVKSSRVSTEPMESTEIKPLDPVFHSTETINAHEPVDIQASWTTDLALGTLIVWIPFLTHVYVNTILLPDMPDNSTFA